MNFSANKGLALTSLIWGVAVLAALLAAYSRGLSMGNLAPYAGVALVPAIISALLWPFARREWVQMLVIFSWIALAIVACFAIAFVPMAVLFLCAPAAAALFEREKVVEAMVLSAIFAGVVFYFSQSGYAPDQIAQGDQISWGQKTGIMATIAFLIGTLIFAAEKRTSTPQVKTDSMAGFADAYPGPALKLNQDGIIVGASPNGRRLFGLTKSDIGKTGIADLIPDSSAEVNNIRSAFIDAQKTGEPVLALSNMPLTYQASDDDSTHIEYNFIPVRNGNGTAEDAGVFVTANEWRDQTNALRSIENGRESAERKADEKNLFFAGVSHELRTPLNAIIGFSDMMRSRLFGPLPGKYGEYADLIHDSGQHMLDLIGDVLDMSKVEAGKYQLNYDQFDVADVVRSSVKMVRPSADAAHVTLNVEAEADKDLLLNADRRALRQILLNLLSNAIKFSAKGGIVTTRTKFHGDDQILISVEDNGIGMNLDELDVIGEPYTQTKSAGMVKDRGTGLGLSLVKRLTSLHGGTFDVFSHPGKGTRIEIYLPVNQPAK